MREFKKFCKILFLSVCLAVVFYGALILGQIILDQLGWKGLLAYISLYVFVCCLAIATTED